MDCCGTRADDAPPAFRGHRVCQGGCPQGTRIFSARGFAKGDPAPCRVLDLRSPCRDVPTKRSSDCRAEGTWEQVRGFGVLRDGGEGLGVWDHAITLPPRL